MEFSHEPFYTFCGLKFESHRGVLFSSHAFLLYKLSGHIATQKDLKNESNETKVSRFQTKAEGEQKGRSPPHWEKIVEEIR